MSEKETMDRKCLVFFPTGEQKRRMIRASFEIIDIFDKYDFTKGEKCMIITTLANAVGMRGAIMSGSRTEAKV